MDVTNCNFPATLRLLRMFAQLGCVSRWTKVVKCVIKLTQITERICSGCSDSIGWSFTHSLHLQVQFFLPVIAVVYVKVCYNTKAVLTAQCNRPTTGRQLDDWTTTGRHCRGQENPARIFPNEIWWIFQRRRRTRVCRRSARPKLVQF